MHEIRQTFSPPNAAFLAMHDGVEIGCAAVKRTGKDRRAATAMLLRLYVRPDSRRLGAARLLVTSAIAFARHAGFHRLVLDTEKSELEAAYRLYRSLGFEECAPFATVSYDTPTFMELPLR
jgi:GNAT superfamily N-acetyltransferase